MMNKILVSLIAFTLTSTFLIAAPQAIVFDFGGVMTGEPNREAVVDFIRESLALSLADFEKVNQEKHQAIKQGKTDEEFWISYAKDKRIRLPSHWTESFKSAMKDAIGANPSMYLLVKELRAKKIPVALLSNIDKRRARFIRESGLYEPFDPCLLSCEIAIEKPDPRAYAFLLAELKLPAHDVVFIDDRPENIEAAKKIGLDAILFTSEQQVRTALTQRGIFGM